MTHLQVVDEITQSTMAYDAIYDSSIDHGVYPHTARIVFEPYDILRLTDTPPSSLLSPLDIGEMPTETHTSNISNSTTTQIYLSEQCGSEIELYRFEDSPRRMMSTEDDTFEPSSMLSSEDLNFEVFPFLRDQVFQGSKTDSGTYPKFMAVSDLSAGICAAPASSRVSSNKAFACQFCDKRFSLKHDLTRHLRTLHRRQKDIIYRCCAIGCAKGGKIFNRLDNFKKHLRTTHEENNIAELVARSRMFSGDAFTILTPRTYPQYESKPRNAMSH